MAIIIPEIIIINTVKRLFKKYFDDLILFEGIGTVLPPSDIDSGVTFTITTTGSLGTPEITDVKLVADVLGSLNGKSWSFSTPGNDYYIWYLIGNKTQLDPKLVGRKGILVPIIQGDSANIVAQKTRDRIQEELNTIGEVNCSTVTVDTFTITNLTSNQKKRSLLFQVFGNNESDNLNYFDQSSLLLKQTFTDEAPKKINIHLGYNESREAYPSINILLPDEENSPKQVGTSQSMVIDVTEDTNQIELQHDFTTTYNLLITSNNQNDVIILYNWVKTLLLQAQGQFIYQGLQNLWISGRDITTSFDLSPDVTYHRTVAMNFHYENSVPSLNREANISAITYNSNQTNLPIAP